MLTDTLYSKIVFFGCSTVDHLDAVVQLGWRVITLPSGYGWYGYPYYSNYCNYWGYGNYWRSVGDDGGDAILTKTDAAAAVSAAFQAKKRTVGEEKEEVLDGEPLARAQLRDASRERDISAVRFDFTGREAASGCADWLGVSEEKLAAAPPNVAVVDDPCCWYGHLTTFNIIIIFVSASVYLHASSFSSSSSCFALDSVFRL